LPGVALTSGTTYAWAATERRIVALGGVSHTGYSDRAPRDVLFTFDSDEARRVARLGETLYITSGLGLMQYDGEKAVECGFLIYPWYFGAIEVGTGNLVDGTYALKFGYRWDNAKGERERSTTATVGTVTIAGGPNGISVVANSPPLHWTLKLGAAIKAPAVEYWRTAVDPNTDSPFYLGTSQDPTATSNPNRYIANDPTASSIPTFNDELSDANLTVREIHPENGSALENLCPPPCRIIVASDTRLFLAGVAGDPDRVLYSKQRNDGEVAAFHDALAIPIPHVGGEMTGLAFNAETLVAFRETAIYALPGDGFDNTGGGVNFGPARLISSDVGAINQESIALTPAGLIFKSRKGWYVLSTGWQLQYIGQAVSDYDSETIVGVDVVEAQHQIRASSSGRMLVFDYLANQWAEWTETSIRSSTVWQGLHVVVAGTSVMTQLSTYTSLTYGIDIETPWIKLGGPQDRGRVRAIEILGEFRSDHDVRVRLAFDYNNAYVDDSVVSFEALGAGSPLQCRVGPSRQQLQAIKIRITAQEEGSPDPPPGEALKLTALSLEVARQPGLYKRLGAAVRT
jgi:hypothetical protein